MLISSLAPSAASEDISIKRISITRFVITPDYGLFRNSPDVVLSQDAVLPRITAFHN
jgi:hypothetical protein